MAEVHTGAKTMMQSGGKSKLPDRIRSIVMDAESKKNKVVVVATCDLLNVTDDKPIFTPTGEFMYTEKGTLLEFHGERTREYDLTDDEDARDIENTRKWLKRGRDSRIDRFKVAIQDAARPRAPFKGFDSFSTNQLTDYVAAFAAEEDDAEAFIAQCVSYEASKDVPREEIIEALGGVMDKPEDGDVIEAEVSL